MLFRQRDGKLYIDRDHIKLAVVVSEEDKVQQRTYLHLSQRGAEFIVELSVPFGLLRGVPFNESVGTATASTRNFFNMPRPPLFQSCSGLSIWISS